MESATYHCGTAPLHCTNFSPHIIVYCTPTVYDFSPLQHSSEGLHYPHSRSTWHGNDMSTEEKTGSADLWIEPSCPLSLYTGCATLFCKDTCHTRTSRKMVPAATHVSLDLLSCKTQVTSRQVFHFNHYSRHHVSKFIPACQKV